MVRGAPLVRDAVVRRRNARIAAPAGAAEPAEALEDLPTARSRAGGDARGRRSPPRREAREHLPRAHSGLRTEDVDHTGASRPWRRRDRSGDGGRGDTRRTSRPRSLHSSRRSKRKPQCQQQGGRLCFGPLSLRNALEPETQEDVAAGAVDTFIESAFEGETPSAPNAPRTQIPHAVLRPVAQS